MIPGTVVKQGGRVTKGNVAGPDSCVDNRLAQFNGTNGDTLEDSGAVLSTDGTFAGNSDAKVPTEKAIKTYVDTKSALADTLNEVFHLGNTITILAGENKSLTVTQNDTTNNPAAVVIANTGSGNDITAPSASLKAGVYTGTSFTDGTATLSAGSLAAGVNIGITGKLTATPDAITSTSEGVAASILTLNTIITTNGDSDLDNVTLADGAAIGQLKNFVVGAVGNAGDSIKITPAHMVGGTIITFAANPLGLGCTMMWTTPGWVVVANNGGTIS